MTAGSKKLCGVVVMTMYLMVACARNDSSFLGQLKLPGFGKSSEGDVLEVPPNLVALEIQDDYVIPGSSMSMRSAAMNSLVLPERLDIRLYRKGNTAWLRVGLRPADAWEYVRAFLEGYGFSIVRQNPATGMLETNWLERVVNQPGNARIRDQFRVRLERDANALTNIYVINRRNQYRGGEWSLRFSDTETELDVLYDLRDYFVRLQANEQLDAKFDLEDLARTLDIANMAGVPVLTVEDVYGEVWRSLGVALERSGMEIHGSDRSRGIYVVRRNAGSDAEDASERNALIEVHLLNQDARTLVTVHPRHSSDRPLPYATAHQLLKQVVWAY